MVQDITKGIVVKKEAFERTIQIGTASSPVVSLGCVNPNNLTDIAKVSGWVVGSFKIQFLYNSTRLSYLDFLSDLERKFRGAKTFRVYLYSCPPYHILRQWKFQDFLRSLSRGRRRFFNKRKSVDVKWTTLAEKMQFKGMFEMLLNVNLKLKNWIKLNIRIKQRVF